MEREVKRNDIEVVEEKLNILKKLYVATKNDFIFIPEIIMPSKADIIDGIPVTLKDGIIYSFSQAGSNIPQIKLGTYKDKVATWVKSDEQLTWLSSFRESMAPRSRK